MCQWDAIQEWPEHSKNGRRNGARQLYEPHRSPREVDGARLLILHPAAHVLLLLPCRGKRRSMTRTAWEGPVEGGSTPPTTHTVLEIPAQSGAWVNTFWETVSPGMLPDLNIRRTNCETDEQEFGVASKHGVALPLYGGHFRTECFAQHAAEDAPEHPFFGGKQT